MPKPALILFILFTAATAHGRPVPFPGSVRILPVFDSSDLVCLCTIESVTVVDQDTASQDGKPVSMPQQQATVLITKLYKGGYSEGSLVTVSSYDIASSGTFLTGQWAIMFLKSSGPGQSFQFSDANIGFEVFSAALPSTTDAKGLQGLEQTWTALLSADHGWAGAYALYLLEGLDSYTSETIARVSILASSTDPEVALPATAVLIRDDPSKGLKKLSGYLTTYTGTEDKLGYLAVFTEISRINDKSLELQLEGLASSRFRSVRLASWQAIKTLEDPHSGQFWISQLDDSDPDTKCTAVLSLEKLYKKDKEYGPGLGLCTKDPASYVNRWKLWWSSQGNTLR